MTSRVVPVDELGGPASMDSGAVPPAQGEVSLSSEASSVADEAERSAPTGRPRWWREMVLIGSVYFAYSLIRNLAPDRVGEAQQNARVILDAERAIGWDVEKGLNLAVSDIPWLALPSIYYYATLHLTLTLLTMIWLYRRRPAQYAKARSVLLVMTLMALVGYWLYPLAPPRLMTGGGYVDTAVKYVLWGYTPSEGLKSVSNQYAAMPSMHVGWALWVGLALVFLARRRWVKALGIAYPFVTLAVIVVTANHFVLDAVVAVAVAAVAWLAVSVWDAAMAGRRPAEPAPPEARASDAPARDVDLKGMQPLVEHDDVGP
jgi:hypothetical protein